MTDSCVYFGNWKQLKKVTVLPAWQQNLVEKKTMKTQPRILYSLFLYPQGCLTCASCEEYRKVTGRHPQEQESITIVRRGEAMKSRHQSGETQNILETRDQQLPGQ